MKANDVAKFASLAWGSSTNETRVALEEKFNCCGFYNTTDRIAEPCPAGKQGSINIKDSCSQTILEVIKDLTVQIAVAAFIVTFFEASTAIITFFLAHRIKVVNKYAAVDQDAFDDYSFDHSDDDDDDDDDVEFLKNDPNGLLE